MTSHEWKETMVERKVTYTVEVEGKLIVIDNVPARVCLETGEQFFSPELQRTGVPFGAPDAERAGG